MLEGEREELAAVAAQPRRSRWSRSRGFVKENREILGRNIKGLNRVAKVLVKQRDALDEILSDRAVALNNLALTYNPQAGTLDTRANLGELGNQIETDPAAFLCGIVNQADTLGPGLRRIDPGPARAAARRRRSAQGNGRPRGETVRPDPRRPRGGGRDEARLPRAPQACCSLAARRRRWCSRGCDFDVYKLPLPGGTDVGDDPITVTVQFRDVLDLVPQSTVKVNDVSVGKVTDVEPRRATPPRSRCELRNDIELPDNAIAEIRQTSLLGEKFVSLGAARDRRQRRAARRRRRDPARAHRPQPRGRGGARRAEPAAQRRRRGPAEDDRQRAQHRARGPRGHGQVGARPDPRRYDASSTTTRPTSSTRSRRSTGSSISVNEQQRHHRRRARGAAERAATRIDRQRDDLVKMLQALNRAQRRRRPGDQGVQGRHHRLAPAARRRC